MEGGEGREREKKGEKEREGERKQDFETEARQGLKALSVLHTTDFLHGQCGCCYKPERDNQAFCRK